MNALTLLSANQSTLQAMEAAGGGLNPDSIVRGVVETGIYVVIGLVVFLIAFFIMTKVIPFDVRKEIEEDQNTALGILMGSVFIGLALIIAAAIGGG